MSVSTKIQTDVFNFNGDRSVNVVDSVNMQLSALILSQIETVMTNVSFIGHFFLNSLFSSPIESGSVGIKLSMPLIWLVEKHDTIIQPHFDQCVFQNLNFPNLYADTLLF